MAVTRNQSYHQSPRTKIDRSRALLSLRPNRYFALYHSMSIALHRYYLCRNPISFHEWTYFLTRSSLIGPVPLKVRECSVLLAVSRITPPHDMRTKFPSKKSTILPAGLSVSVDPGNWRTRLIHFWNEIMLERGIASALARTRIISGHGWRVGFSMW